MLVRRSAEKMWPEFRFLHNQRPRTELLYEPPHIPGEIEGEQKNRCCFGNSTLGHRFPGWCKCGKYYW
jgi:hypothetical protein